MIISGIVAYGENGIMGLNGDMPWKLKGDLAHFKRTTLKHPIIMGRKTWDSLYFKPLPGRRNIVITRQNDWQEEGAEVFHSLKDALEALSDAPEVFIIGGAQLFAQALPILNRLYITEIHASFEGDTFFPALDEHWHCTERLPQATENGLAYDFCLYERYNLNFEWSLYE